MELELPFGEPELAPRGLDDLGRQLRALAFSTEATPKDIALEGVMGVCTLWRKTMPEVVFCPTLSDFRHELNFQYKRNRVPFNRFYGGYRLPGMGWEESHRLEEQVFGSCQQLLAGASRAIEHRVDPEIGHLEVGQFSSRALGLELLRRLDKPLNDPDAGRAKLARSCAAAHFNRGRVLVLERPCRLELNQQGLLHCEDGPALVWPDGRGEYFLNGRLVSEQILFAYRSTPISLRNLEDRDLRLAIERMGLERFLEVTSAELVGEDDEGRIWSLTKFMNKPSHLLELTDPRPQPGSLEAARFVPVGGNLRRPATAREWAKKNSWTWNDRD